MNYVNDNPKGCLIKECSNGNNDAYLCAAAIFAYIDWLDNIIDKDVPIPYEASAKTSLNLFVMLSYNHFWLENRQHLAPVLVTAYNAWIDSEKIKDNGDYRIRVASDVLKGYFMEVFYQIAFITGGYDLMRSLSEKWRGFDFDSAPDDITQGLVQHVKFEDKPLSKWIYPKEGRVWNFPYDHGYHPGFQFEWWYFSGILESEGKKYGYHFCEFRIEDKFIQHLSTVDLQTGVFKFQENFTDSPVVQFEAGDRASIKTDYLNLEFKYSDQTIFLQGDNGLSVKSNIDGHSSHYYSILHVRTSGNIGGLELSGTSWFDHEFGSLMKPPGIEWVFFYARFDAGETINGYIMIRDGQIDYGHSRLNYVTRTGQVPNMKFVVDRKPTQGEAIFNISSDPFHINVKGKVLSRLCDSTLGAYLEIPCEVTMNDGEKNQVGLGYLEISG